MSSTNGAEKYAVGYSAAHLEQLGAWGELARKADQSDSYLAAVKEMRERLEHAPKRWGDPLRSLPAMKVDLFRKYGPVLMVFYAVHAERRVVIVQQIVLTPGSPLANDAADPPPG
jgi:hypothetical protein